MMMLMMMMVVIALIATLAGFFNVSLCGRYVII